MIRIFIAIILAVSVYSTSYAGWKDTDGPEDTSLDGTEVLLGQNTGGTDENWFYLSTLKAWVLNALGADSISDTTATHKFTTASDIAKMANVPADTNSGLAGKSPTPLATVRTTAAGGSTTTPATEAATGDGLALKANITDLQPMDAYVVGFMNLAEAPWKAYVGLDDIWTASGVTDGATHYGTFTGSLLTDNQTGKALFQIIETAVEGKQAADADLDSWAAIPPATGSINTTGTMQSRVVINSYTAAQTLTASAHNASTVQMTTADEVTLWDCETAGIGQFVTLWSRDAEKIEVVPASGDHFNLFNGTALTADYELDIAATAGTKVVLMCTADDTWSVYSETVPCADGGTAD